MQVILQMKSVEIQTVQSADGMKEIELAYEPVWVLAKSADSSHPKAEDVSSASDLFGGWKLCARLNDHEVGKKNVGNRREVASMIPEGAVHAQLQKAWQAAKFSFANDPVTWSSWFIRWALEIK